MCKIKNITVILVALFMVAIVATPIYAAAITNVTYSTDTITISGTCDTGDQVQVVLFDLNKQPMYFTTVDVVNGKFDKKLDAKFDLTEGKTYTVKVADYEGKGVKENTFVAKTVKAKDVSPNTGR